MFYRSTQLFRDPGHDQFCIDYLGFLSVGLLLLLIAVTSHWLEYLSVAALGTQPGPPIHCHIYPLLWHVMRTSLGGTRQQCPISHNISSLCVEPHRHGKEGLQISR